MTRDEFRDVVERAVKEVLALAERHHDRVFRRPCVLRWFGQDAVVENVVDALVDRIYLGPDRIRPCVDLGVTELDRNGAPVLVALVSGHEPCPFCSSWSGREGPFNYYVAGRLATHPVKGSFTYSVVLPDQRDDERDPIWMALVEKTMFCESGTWLERVVIALVMASAGSLLLAGLYLGSWMSPGFMRGVVAWLAITVFFAKAINLVECGGPIPSAILGVLVALVLEA